MPNPDRQTTAIEMEIILRKAYSQMLVLHLLKSKPCYIGEITERINEDSGFILQYADMYCTVNTLLEGGYVVQDKKPSPDNRMRRYYTITDNGKKRYETLVKTYERFQQGICQIMSTAKK